MNAVEPHMESERVFANLNTNKVPLTEVELIKGLLLTKVARDNGSQNSKRFKEILERRASIGRQWDEMAHWFNQKEIKRFFFEDKADGLQALLELVVTETFKKSNQPLLFNYFHSQIKKGTTTAAYYFEKIKLYYAILQKWYAHTEIYNFMGYLFYTKLLKTQNLNDYFKLSNTEVIKGLKQKVINGLPIVPIDSDFDSCFNYESDKDKVRQLLLLIDLFNIDKNATLKVCDYRFPFDKLASEYNKSIEHIYPQNPAQPHLPKEHPMYKTQTKLKPADTTDLNWEKTCFEPYLNQIGNLVLVTSAINSALSNQCFKEKRDILRTKIIKQGKFVPPHTYDVFNKIFSEKGELEYWTIQDIEGIYEAFKDLMKYSDQPIQHGSRFLQLKDLGTDFGFDTYIKNIENKPQFIISKKRKGLLYTLLLYIIENKSINPLELYRLCRILRNALEDTKTSVKLEDCFSLAQITNILDIQNDTTQQLLKEIIEEERFKLDCFAACETESARIEMETVFWEAEDYKYLRYKIQRLLNECPIIEGGNIDLSAFKDLFQKLKNAIAVGGDLLRRTLLTEGDYLIERTTKNEYNLRGTLYDFPTSTDDWINLIRRKERFIFQLLENITLEKDTKEQFNNIIENFIPNEKKWRIDIVKYETILAFCQNKRMFFYGEKDDKIILRKKIYVNAEDIKIEDFKKKYDLI